MTQSDKKLLLKDLCARIPYGVKVSARYTGTNELYDGIIEGITYIDIENIEYSVQFTDSRCPYRCGATEARPYLRPMSSMTGDEKRELTSNAIKLEMEFLSTKSNGPSLSSISSSLYEIDWLNAHHFDYRGLIEKGLALKAPEEMYKTE